MPDLHARAGRGAAGGPDPRGGRPSTGVSAAIEPGGRWRIAFSGDEGAFAHEACLRFLPDWVPVARAGFSAALEAVDAGEAGAALLPLSNSIAGPVPGIAERIEESRLSILALYSLPVRLHLLALPGVSIEEIRTVASHPMALAQCRRWLSESGLTACPRENTATAALRLAQGRSRSLAVVASQAAARLYNLQILLQDLQDLPDNCTTFGLVARPEAAAR